MNQRQALSNMGLSHSMTRDDNKFKLERAIIRGDVRTVTSAMQFLNLSQSTILKYLKELDVSIVNDRVKPMKMTNGLRAYYIDD